MSFNYTKDEKEKLIPFIATVYVSLFGPIKRDQGLNVSL
jgi:hypothetical protein